MKRVILGDPHGNYNIIEDIYNKEKPDSVIVLGDYCDSFVHGTPEILSAYKKLRKLQKKHGADTFITLLGNHDWHYINANEKYSGYKQKTWVSMHDMLNEDFNNGRLPIVYVDSINKTIYSHAGVTKTWMSEWRVQSLEDINNCNIHGLCFQSMSFDMYGNSKWQGPLWVRPEALLGDFYGDGEWKQVVGHTRTKNGKPLIVKMPKYQNVYDNPDEAWLYVIDTLPFVYMRETLDDNGKLISRELVENIKYSEEKSVQ